MCHSGRPLLILAGVGTGKTETLMRKYAYLIAKGVDPTQIMCVTFTNKAAKEMQKRAAHILNLSLKDLDGSWINTFHSLSNKILEDEKNFEKAGLKEKYHILDSED